jgi:hypothetical protein
MMRAAKWTGNLEDFLDDYRYQMDLTRKLDAVGEVSFDQPLINEIVLWKVNRFAPLTVDALAALNDALRFMPGNHREATDVVATLLLQPGVDLPMASTFLRFRQPRTFQIIDRHAYRALTGSDYPLYSASSDERKIEVYFEYLDGLIALARSKGIAFNGVDRILYIFDKQKNGKL